MNAYKLQIRIESALGTPLAADTLFGHVCWTLRYTRGESALTGFLDAYDGPEPPLVLSDPFPEGMLPMPILPAPGREAHEMLLAAVRAKRRSELTERLHGLPVNPDSPDPYLSQTECFDVAKWLRKLNWLPADILTAGAPFSPAGAFLHLLDEGMRPVREPVLQAVPHNSIDRLRGGTVEGGLFFTEEYFIDSAEPPVYDLYLWSGRFGLDEIEALFRTLFDYGYGKYKSRGKGRLSLTGIEPFIWPEAPDPNAVMLLGPCLPRPDDPTDGYWTLFTRFGKLGGHWATGPGPGAEETMPFKYPVSMLRSGSVFKTPSPRPYYGRLARDVHPEYKQVRHYGIAPALPLNCDFKEVQ